MVILIVEMMTEIRNVCFITDIWIMAFGFITCFCRKLSRCVKLVYENRKLANLYRRALLDIDSTSRLRSLLLGAMNCLNL